MGMKIAQPSDMPCAMMDRRGKDWRGQLKRRAPSWMMVSLFARYDLPRYITKTLVVSRHGKCVVLNATVAEVTINAIFLSLNEKMVPGGGVMFLA